MTFPFSKTLIIAATGITLATGSAAADDAYTGRTFLDAFQSRCSLLVENPLITVLNAVLDSGTIGGITEDKSHLVFSEQLPDGNMGAISVNSLRTSEGTVTACSFSLFRFDADGFKMIEQQIDDLAPEMLGVDFTKTGGPVSMGSESSLLLTWRINGFPAPKTLSMTKSDMVLTLTVIKTTPGGQ
jgi:hypothetical protein